MLICGMCKPSASSFLSKDTNGNCPEGRFFLAQLTGQFLPGAIQSIELRGPGGTHIFTKAVASSNDR